MIQAGLEPATMRLEGACSIQIELLNQRRKNAESGNRTHTKKVLAGF